MSQPHLNRKFAALWVAICALGLSSTWADTDKSSPKVTDKAEIDRANPSQAWDEADNGAMLARIQRARAGAPVNPSSKLPIAGSASVRGGSTGPLEALDISYFNNALAGASISGHATRPAVSSNGEFVAFTSLASNLVAGDTNGFGDVFRYEIDTDTYEMVSGGDGSSGIAAFRAESGPVFQLWNNGISADGEWVSFTSESSDLVTGDANGWADVFVADMTGAPAYARVSVDAAGAEDTEGRSIDGVIAPNKSGVAFSSLNDFGNGSDTSFSGGGFDVFYKALPVSFTAGNLATALTLCSHETSGVNVSTPNTPLVSGTTLRWTTSLRPSISDDGEFVVYDTSNPRIGTGITSLTNRHVFAWTRTSNTNAQMDLNAAGTVNNTGTSFNAHISPDGSQVAFTSSSDLIGGTTTAATNVFARARATAGSIRRANMDAAGTTRLNTFTARGHSASVDNSGNVLFWSIGDSTDGFPDPADVGPAFTADLYYKSFSAAAPSSAGALTLISKTIGGTETVASRGLTRLGDGFWEGPVDRAFRYTNSGVTSVLFVSTGEELATEAGSSATHGLKNIFSATIDGSNAATAQAKFTNGDPAINATVGLDEAAMGEDFSTGLTKPRTSPNGQWVGFATHSSNFIDTIAFGAAAESTTGTNVASVNLVSGQAFTGNRLRDGSIQINTSLFSFGAGNNALVNDPLDLPFDTTLGSSSVDDIFVRRTHGLQFWGASVNNDGGVAYYSLGDILLNDDTTYVTNTTHLSAMVCWNLDSVSNGDYLRNEANGDDEVIGDPINIGGIFFNGTTYYSGGGQFVAFGCDAGGVASDTDPATAWSVVYRYDTGADDTLLTSVGRPGFQNDGDCVPTGINTDGSKIAFFALDGVSNIANSIGDPQGSQVWVRDVLAGTTRLVSSNGAGVASATADPAGLNNSFSGGIEFSGDFSKVVFPSNANNLVAGIDGAATLNVYLKNLTGAHPDAGSISCISLDTGAQPFDANGPDDVPNNGDDEFAQGASISDDGFFVTFNANSDDLVASDTNGQQFDIFAKFGSGNLRLYSNNDAGDQSQPGTAAKSSSCVRSGVYIVVFEMDSGDIETNPTGLAPTALSGNSYTKGLFTKSESVVPGAAQGWELFE